MLYGEESLDYFRTGGRYGLLVLLAVASVGGPARSSPRFNYEQNLFLEYVKNGYEAGDMLNDLQDLISKAIKAGDQAYRLAPVSIGYTAFREYYSSAGQSSVNAMRAINAMNTTAKLCSISATESAALRAGDPAAIALIAGLQLALQVTPRDCAMHQWRGY